MAFSYDLLTRNGKRARSNVSLEPNCIVAVYRYLYKSTYDFASGVSKSKRGTKLRDIAVAQYPDDPLFIQQWTTNVEVTRAKGSHTGSASISTKDPQQTIFRTVAPGDWIAIWMLDNKEEADIVYTRIANGEAANQTMSGLKFIGRVTNVRLNINVQPNGLKDRTVLLECHSFTELDSNIYFDTTMIENDKTQSAWMANAAKVLTGSLKAGEDMQPYIYDVEEALFALIGLFLGIGPFDDSQIGDGTAPKNAVDAKYTERTPNEAYLVPTGIGKVLGRTVASKAGGNVTFADIMTVFLGAEEFANAATPSDKTVGLLSNEDIVQFMSPTLSKRVSKIQGKYMYQTGKSLAQKFNPQTQVYDNVPFWHILSTYLMPEMNEMYTSMRVGPDGAICPTLTFRQRPFTSRLGSRRLGDLTHTCFYDIPRWQLHPNMIFTLDVARSDALRINFCRIIASAGTNGVSDKDDTATGYFEGGLGIDELDIFRNGLRAKFATVPTILDREHSSKWTDLVFDYVAMGHLKLNGTIICSGIQEPINPGDNCVLDGVIYHIENISDTISTSDNGTREWRTMLALTYGTDMKAENDEESASWPKLLDQSAELDTLKERKDLLKAPIVEDPPRSSSSLEKSKVGK